MKKGFTLVELLAVIILLGILLTFTYTKVTNIAEKKENEISDAKIALINNATSEYIENNSDTYQVGSTYCIELKTLVEENLVPVDITDVQKKYNYVKVQVGTSQNTYKLVQSDSDNF